MPSSKLSLCPGLKCRKTYRKSPAVVNPGVCLSIFGVLPYSFGGFRAGIFAITE